MHNNFTKILIMTPSARSPSWGYINSVEAVEAYVRGNGINGNTLISIERMTEMQCSNLSQGRQSMLDVAINEDFTYGIFIDDDMEFPHNILDVMFRNINSYHDRSPSNPLMPGDIKALGVNALRKDQDKMSYTAIGTDGNVMTSDGQRGVEKALTCGLGFFIIDIESLKRIAHPHFEVHWCPVRRGYVGEDRFFTSKLRAGVISTYIDHDASHMIGHIGDFSYRYDSMRHVKQMTAKEVITTK